MSENTFVLGVGAQKSGTTWLFDYLMSFDEFDMGMIKEYHVWDALKDPENAFFGIDGKLNLSGKGKKKGKAKRKGGDAPEASPNLAPGPIRRQMLRHLMQSVDGFYELYFSSLMNEKTHITGDITPSYSILDADDYRNIKARLESKGFQVKVVFLMRDPYERTYSSVRMRLRNRQGRGAGKVPSEADFLKSSYKRDIVQAKTSYETVVRNIEAVFPPEDTFFGIYETFISEAGVRQLGETLGIGVKLDRFDVRLNVSQKQSVIPDELKKEVMESFRSTYEFCYDRFPETREVWHQLD